MAPATEVGSTEDLERMLFFKRARDQAEADWKANNNDAMALTRWGGAILELAQFHQGPEAVHMIEQAVGKFEAALAINPRKHDALWCLGNALTSQGFLFAEAERAQGFFDKAKSCFERALKEEPTNDVYKKSLEMTAKAPSLHAELQRQLAAQQQQQQQQLALHGGGAADKAEADSQFYYDVAGWVIFGGIVCGWVGMFMAQNK